MLVALSIFVLWPDYSTAGASCFFEDIIWSKCMHSFIWAARYDSDKWQNSVWLKLKADRLGYGLRPSLVFCMLLKLLIWSCTQAVPSHHHVVLGSTGRNYLGVLSLFGNQKRMQEKLGIFLVFFFF